MTSMLTMEDFAISNKVIDEIVTNAVEKIEGVAYVMGHNVSAHLFSFFSQKTPQPTDTVTSDIVDGKIEVTVPVAVFFGYEFPELAEKIRQETVRALKTQIAVDVSVVNVRIDQLIFPKS